MGSSVGAAKNDLGLVNFASFDAFFLFVDLGELLFPLPPMAFSAHVLLQLVPRLFAGYSISFSREEVMHLRLFFDVRFTVGVYFWGFPGPFSLPFSPPLELRCALVTATFLSLF